MLNLNMKEKDGSIKVNNNIHIVIPSSDFFAPYTSVLITSIIKNKADDDEIFIHIISEDISKHSIKAIESIKSIGDFTLDVKYVNKILIEEIAECSTKRIGNICNYKLFISSLFPFDRVIVLESDMIVLGSLKNLYNLDMLNCPMAAVKDPICNEYQHLFDIPPEYRYCNTGMFLANLEYWRENDCENKFLASAQKYREKLWLPDQDIFNNVFYKEIKYLPPQYNVYAAVSHHNFPDEQREADNNPIIIHWADYKKPWIYLDTKYGYKFWEYAKSCPLYETIFYRLNNPFSVEERMTAIRFYNEMALKKLKRKIFIYKIKYFLLRSKRYTKKINRLEEQITQLKQF